MAPHPIENEHRKEHRLPVDESVVRVFAIQPEAAMINNGCEHVLRCVANHWKNLLHQEDGNFAHQVRLLVDNRTAVFPFQ